MAETTHKSSAPKKTTATKAGIDAKAQTKPEAAKKAAPAVETSRLASAAGTQKTPVTQSKTTVKKKVLSDEQRYLMIAEAAYFRAESCQFKSDPVRDWIDAERDIAILLGEGK
ncbi:MAG: DUF2934 domain-containing protein [Candidatus Accumulibacter sp.]|jgi:hypothetical protein|nr:DUF2934 domain-containing protein [Accumulibacter sp.]